MIHESIFLACEWSTYRNVAFTPWGAVLGAAADVHHLSREDIVGVCSFTSHVTLITLQFRVREVRSALVRSHNKRLLLSLSSFPHTFLEVFFFC